MTDSASRLLSPAPTTPQNGSSHPPKRPDAGMREHNHYQKALPRWRYTLRRSLIPIVRYETPYLARLQSSIRTPTLDSYFAFTANLGTHTFFMIMLPIFIWCGHAPIGIAFTRMLAAGVFFSGFIKDLLCLPRPLSPPLRRITMSGSAALEYGFPSTHSTNAISVVVYALWFLHSKSDGTAVNWAGRAFAYLYGFSIVFGRLYCGMHGYFDVISGSLLGASIGILQVSYGPAFESWIRESDSAFPVIMTCLIILILVRIHPEPADDCPCFDDSVAFAGVVMGLEMGLWHITKLSRASSSGPGAFGIRDLYHPHHGDAASDMNSLPPSRWDGLVSHYANKALFDSFSYQDLGFAFSFTRVFLGVLIIFAWRGLMKPTLLHTLPPIFRVIEYLGFDLPRRFFLRASEYTTVPPLRQDDNVIPPVTEIPGRITRILGRRGGRRVSVGPQSVADAYETLHNRRRHSMERVDGQKERAGGTVGAPEWTGSSYSTSAEDRRGAVVFPSTEVAEPGTCSTTSSSASISAHALQLGSGSSQLTGSTASVGDHDHFGDDATPEDEADDAETLLDADDQHEDHDDVFSHVTTVRVRYDVEVVTKLIVYFGIAWLAVEVNPILFQALGLTSGVDVRL